MQYYTTLILSSLAMFLGLSAYYQLYKKYSKTLEGQTLQQKFVNLISHMPEMAAGPASHIFAGTAFVTGLSLVTSTILVDAFVPSENFMAAVVSASGLLISIVFATVAIWTLWQARRIEFQAGYKIHDFHALIRELNVELERIITSFQRTYQQKAQPFHRVYFITTHPFFGELSYPQSTQTRHFKEHLRSLADIRAASIKSVFAGTSKMPFEFHVACGNEEAIRDFVNFFFKGGDVSKDFMESKIEETEADIHNMNQKVVDANGIAPFHRLPEVPPVQFMVIGNKLFEFTLDGKNTETEVFNTQVVQDKRFCENYIQTFKYMVPDDLYVQFPDSGDGA